MQRVKFAGIMEINGYKAMWVLSLFDLPVLTKQNKRHYIHFRKELLKDGFTMLQYSVYARHCASEENADVHEARVKSAIPPEGEVRILMMTDKQFERMKIYRGPKYVPPESPPAQLELF